MKGRYIKADALKERLIQNITLTNAIDRSFREAPSIDIVFCKECKKHNTHRCHMAFDLVATKAEDFCSYGERSSDEQ